MKKLIIFASGTSTGGGSGFNTVALKVKSGDIRNTEIVAVVSNHQHGGVREKADRLGIPFIYFKGPYTAESYQKIAKDTGADFAALSGWIKPVRGLDPRTTFNIHPGPLPKFGGKGMYGYHVHEAVLAAFKARKITLSAVTLHFVIDEYDKGPVAAQIDVPIYDTDTADTLGKRVNDREQEWQWPITDKIINGEIYWDGKNPYSLVGWVHVECIG